MSLIQKGITGGGFVLKTLIGNIRAANVQRMRYFRRNSGGIDYATIPEVTLAGDFEIEFVISAPAQLDNKALSFRNTGAVQVFNIGSGSGGSN